MSIRLVFAGNMVECLPHSSTLLHGSTLFQTACVPFSLPTFSLVRSGDIQDLGPRCGKKPQTGTQNLRELRQNNMSLRDLGRLSELVTSA